jgi:predicted transcriptional regulator
MSSLTAPNTAPKPRGKKIVVRVDSLKTNLFVREKLDDDRVQFFLDLFVAGEPIEMIEVNKDREIIDGRHRHMMYQLADVVEIEVLERDITDPEELIATAYQANMGGSLPPTRQDTEHTIGLLVERNATVKRISEILALPPSMVRTYVKEVKAKIERRAIQNALHDITVNGLTVQAAADKNCVGVDKVKNAIAPKKKKERKQVAGEIKRRLTTLHRSSNLKEANIYKKMAEGLEDGDVTLAQVNEVLGHIGQLQRRAAKTHEDWSKRFNARPGTEITQ